MITKLLQRYLRTLHKILKAFVFEPLSSLQQGKLFPDDLEATADWPIQDQFLFEPTFVDQQDCPRT